MESTVTRPAETGAIIRHLTAPGVPLSEGGDGDWQEKLRGDAEAWRSRADLLAEAITIVLNAAGTVIDQLVLAEALERAGHPAGKALAERERAKVVPDG